MVTIQYGIVHSLTVEAGDNVNTLISNAVDLSDIDGDLSAHCNNGAIVDGDYIPEDGSVITLRNTTPAKKGVIAIAA
jgi:hypothetical protein